MEERYLIKNIINNQSDINIDGDYTNKIHQKHTSKYSKQSADELRNNVRDIFSESQRLLMEDDIENNMLLVGKVQSGKTSNLEMLTALAFDNEYKCMIIYGGYDTKLLQQTTERFKNTFDITQETMRQNKIPVVLSTADEDISQTWDERTIKKLIVREKPIIIVALKGPNALSKVNKFCYQLNNLNIKTFIIDDEGDQASLNTEIKKNKKSATYSEIERMKKNLGNPLYISVTATPQANVLLGKSEYSKLKPEKVKLIRPSRGYTGADFFHMGETEKIITVPECDTEIDKRITQSLSDALNHFIIASVLLKKRGISESDMIVHVDRKVSEHENIQNILRSRLQEYSEAMTEDEKCKRFVLNEIKTVYNEKFFDNSLLRTYDFDNDLSELILEVIDDTEIILFNSKGQVTSADELIYHKIYVGGDLLQRGITFDKLVTTFFTRRAKSGGTMDTTIQRARWFGYREKYLDLCRVFMTEELSLNFSDLTESESDLWEQIENIEKGMLSIDDIMIQDVANMAGPSRANVVNFSKTKHNKTWYRQKLGIFENMTNAHNKKIIEGILSKYTFTDSNVGTLKGGPTNQFSEISKEDFLYLLNETKNIFNNAPFDEFDLNKSLKFGLKIILQKMYNENEEPRKRTFFSEKVLYLHQGPNSSDPEKVNYKGDIAVINDETAITIQLFKIKDKNNMSADFQYMFAITLGSHAKNYKDVYRRK